MYFTLRAKFEVSNVIPTSFRPVGGGGGVGVVLPSTPPQNKPLKIPPRFGLILSLCIHLAKEGQNQTNQPTKNKPITHSVVTKEFT